MLGDTFVIALARHAAHSVLPTGWAMDAMHKLADFAYPADVVIPYLAELLGGALALG